MLEKLKEKITNLEKAIKQNIANHNFMNGVLQGLKESVALLEMIDPASPITEGLKVAETIASDAQ